MLDAESAKWSPYPSKIMFLLDAIDNLPRLRVSGSFMKVLLWLLRELGIKHVPSFDALRKKQKLLREETGVPTIHWMSPKGNTYSFNDPRALVSNVKLFDLLYEMGGLPCLGLVESSHMSTYLPIPCHPTQRNHIRNLACSKVA
jgi:hypothetical protein